MLTFEEFIDSSGEFVCIVYMQDGYDAKYDKLCDIGADAQEKASYLA